MKNVVLVVAMAVVAAGEAWGRDQFVDQAHSLACDTNNGTEAQPFKTIQAGVNAAQSGDTIYIKEGFYEERVKIDKKALRKSPITLSSWKDDRVCMGSEPKEAPKPADWTPIAGTKSWKTTLPEGTANDVIVLFDDKAQPCEYKAEPPKDDQRQWSTYDRATRTLCVNAGGDNPATQHKLTLARTSAGNLEVTPEASSWTLRGIAFQYGNTFITSFGTYITIEDCQFHYAYRRAIFGTGYLCRVRRCTFDDAAIHGAWGATTLFEDNIFYKGNREWDEDIQHRVMNYHEGSGGFMFKGLGHGMIIRHNFFDGTGFWPDGDGTGCQVYGNAFHDNRGYAIYNEFAADDTLIIGNYMANCQAGIASSWSTRMNVVENFIEDCGSGVIWHTRDKWPLRNSYMLMRGNAVVNAGVGIGGYSNDYDNFPSAWSSAMVDFNHYRLAANGVLVDLDGKTRINNMDDMRQKLGWELHGEAKAYDGTTNDLTPEALSGGTVTVRLPVGERSWKSRPMLADPDINGKFPAAVRYFATIMPSFFWRFSDGDYNERTLNAGYFELNWGEQVWLPGSWTSDEPQDIMGASWHVDTDRIAGQEKLHISAVLDSSDRNRFLTVTGKAPEKMLKQGIGWWTPSLPTCPGAEITVSFKVRTRDLEKAGDLGGAAVWMQFTSMTGQKKTRTFCLGRDDQGKDVRADLMQGSHDWTEIRETITAPKEAGRMALFLGMRPGKGRVNFDSINIKTQSGEAPKVVKREVLPPRLPLERFKETFYVDLKALVNRSLTDDEPNNGKGGWSDQGPSCDMRGVKTGERKFGGVPFNILDEKGNSIIVLKSKWRNPGNLPEKVDIPVGRVADTLFFLHGAAYFNHFTYILHYADGKDIEIKVDATKCYDWTTDPKIRFEDEVGTFSTAAETVPNPTFRQGTLYRTEWSSPADRRGVELKSISFVNSGGCVPALVAITGVMEW
jgi:hypothetical protein